MPQITLYVKETDRPLWDSARRLADSRGESLSALVTTALELVAGRRDAPAAPSGEMARVELVGWDFRNRDVPRTVRFTGAKVAQVGTLSAYLTRARQVVLEEWELLDERYQTRATVVTSQLPVAHWHDALGDPTLADAILDRLVHHAHPLTLSGESLRKVTGPPALAQDAQDRAPAPLPTGLTAAS